MNEETNNDIKFFEITEKTKLLIIDVHVLNFVQFQKMWFNFRSLITSGFFIFIYFWYLWGFFISRICYFGIYFFIIVVYWGYMGGLLFIFPPVVGVKGTRNFTCWTFQLHFWATSTYLCLYLLIWGFTQD